jgi:isoleucyl-tRNA synthetase
MNIMLDGLTRLLAPILSFTADELWGYMPATRVESVHMALFPTRAELETLRDPELVARWDALAEVRQRVLAEIEPLRKNKQIGSSLQAKVVITAPQTLLPLLERHARDLPMLFIVSEVELRAGGSDGEPLVTIERASGVKCERCWRYVPSVSSDPAWAGLCERCQDALSKGDRAA